jgi:predicted lipase
MLTWANFHSVGLGDTQGFVALDHTNQLIVISFRGSQSIQNWISNLDVAMEPFSICSGCQAHSGFLDSWNSAKTIVQGAIDGAKSANPSYNIVATGHSLGAALATLAAADLRNSGYKMALVRLPSTFAARRD